MACQQVADEEPGAGVAGAVVEHEHAPQAGAFRVGIHLGELHPEPFLEVGGPEVVESGAGNCLFENRLHRELGVLRVPVLQAHALHVGQVRVGEVVDVDLVCHLGHPAHIAR